MSSLARILGAALGCAGLLAANAVLAGETNHHGRAGFVVAQAGGCPPGLAKKHNGCRPPGLAKGDDYRGDYDRRDEYRRRDGDARDAYREGYEQGLRDARHWDVGDRMEEDRYYSRIYDWRRYDLPPPPQDSHYALYGEDVYLVDDALQVLEGLGALSRLMNN